MKAIQIHTYGGPEVLQLEEVERPAISGNEVLVKVFASSVNPVDWKAREGYTHHSLGASPANFGKIEFSRGIYGCLLKG